MDWFHSLFGFREAGADSVHANIALQGDTLLCHANGRRLGAGTLELVSLAGLRARVAAQDAMPEGAALRGRLRASVVAGDVRAMHLEPAYAGALFQVASQFNLLEMPGYMTTPDDGITGYAHDHTQGPACAQAAAAATLYRNYFVPVGGQPGQSAARQLDGIADLGAALAQALGMPVSALWTMRNGYALCTQPGLKAITAHLAGLDEAGRDALRALLRIGVHHRVQVTDALDGTADAAPVLVSQAFCSALPVAYGRGVPEPLWEALARLVLEAAYEATLLAAVDTARRPGGSPTVLLTRLGGGVFGNADTWIDDAIRRALRCQSGHALDVRLVAYRGASARDLELVRAYA